MSNDRPDDLPDLRDVLDGPERPFERSSEAGPDELRAIVGRARSRVVRLVAPLAVLVLALGGIGGYLIADDGSRVTTLQSGGSTTGTGASASATVPSIAGPSTGSKTGDIGGPPVIGPFTASANGVLRRVFVRTTAAGVTIRIFSMTPAPITTTVYSAEISTTDMVGTVGSLAVPGVAAPLTGVVGGPEGAPVAVVIDRPGPAVAWVTWTSGGATDAMAPVGGFVALALPAPVRTVTVTGTLTFTDAAGKVTATEQVPAAPAAAPTTIVVPAPTTSVTTCAPAQSCVGIPPAEVTPAS